MAMEIRRPATAFSLDPSRKEQGGRIEDPQHLKFIRSLPCLASGGTYRIEAAHVRYPDPRYGKPGTPMARKPDDKWTVPLSAEMHREERQAQHKKNERQWWADLGIDPLAVAEKLHAATGDFDAGLQIIMDARAALAPWRR